MTTLNVAGKGGEGVVEHLETEMRRLARLGVEHMDNCPSCKRGYETGEDIPCDEFDQIWARYEPVETAYFNAVFATEEDKA